MKPDAEPAHELIVVDCGVAGLSAAVAAAKSGARVVVLERARLTLKASR